MMLQKIILGIMLVFCFWLTSCSSKVKRANGYVEGRYTYIASNVSGVLQQLLVKKGEYVKKGQALFILDPQPQYSQYLTAVEDLKSARAARDTVLAKLAYSNATYERYSILFTKKAIEKAQLDQEKSIQDDLLAQLRAAEANIAAKTAELTEATWLSAQKNLPAPIDALVFDTYYRMGEYTTAEKPILALLGADDLKAIFYIPESNLSTLHLNDVITVTCDGCGHDYQATINFISPTAEYTPPVIYSSETNEKLVYRIEAKFDKKSAYNLHPGQPISITFPLNKS